MKNRFMVTLSVLLLIVMSAFADEQVVVEYDNLGDFTEIDASESFVGRIYLTQGDKHCVTVKGDKDKVERMKVDVKNGVLVLNRIKPKGEKNQNMELAVDIYVTMKDIRKINMRGVGNVTAQEQLNLDELGMNLEGVCNAELKDVKCNDMAVMLKGVSNFTGNAECSRAGISLEGVCNATLDVQCDNLGASLRGVGNLTLRGTAGSAQIKKEGLGHINRKNLKVRD